MRSVCTISGLVTDGSGAVVPGVTVGGTNTATSQTRTVVTGQNGSSARELGTVPARIE